jgi:hypothetical protein
MTMPLVPPPAPDEQSVVRRVIKKINKNIKLPLVSGATSAGVMFACLAAACTVVYLVSMRVGLRPWIRFELMMAMWWLVWAIALARVLFRGVRISDDLPLHQPRSWFGGGRAKSTSNGQGSGWDWLNFGGVGPIEAEGCAWVIGIVLALCLVLVLAWLLVEVIVPVLAFLFYAMIRGMLARIANNDHGCANHAGRAVLWGTLWATVYTAPLALLVWVIHLIVAYRTV